MRKMICVLMIILMSMFVMGCAVQQSMESAPRPVEKDHYDEPYEESEPAYKPVEKTVQPVEPVVRELSLDQQEAKAVDAAKDFVKNLDGFKNQKGRGIEIMHTAKVDCDGCWIVELSFTRNNQYYPEKIEHISMNIKLKDWEMDSYTFR